MEICGTKMKKYHCHVRELDAGFDRLAGIPEHAAQSVAEEVGENQLQYMDEFWIEVQEEGRKTPYLFQAVRDPKPRFDVIDHTRGEIGLV